MKRELLPGLISFVFLPTKRQGGILKTWMQKIAEQFEMDWSSPADADVPSQSVDEERGTLLFVLDAYSKHLFDTDGSTVRKTRETFDELMKEYIKNNPEKNTKILFRIRQFFSSHRIEEYTYVQKTFDDFRAIIWEFVDHLGEEVSAGTREESEIGVHLKTLRDAVEMNSIELLKKSSREFIDKYVEIQTRKDQRKEKTISSFKKNLQVIKKKLSDTQDLAKKDHLTGAMNRKSFDEAIKKQMSLFKLSKNPVTLMSLDIDHFKKINDAYGHDMGDHILKEFVKILQDAFSIESQSVCRVGGEEFIVILPNFKSSHAEEKANQLMNKIRKEVFVKDDFRIQFTVSVGIAEIIDGESVEQWIKRADVALYQSKKTGRNKCTISEGSALKRVA